MPWIWRHPKTGIYWFRRATPRDLIAARDQLAGVGIKVPREALKTLGTRDPGAAERAACEENQRCVARWESWRELLANGPRVLSQKEIFALSARIGERLADRISDNPGDPERRQRMQRALAAIADAPLPDEADYLGAVLNAILPPLLREFDIPPALAPASLVGLREQFIKDAPLMAGDIAAMATGNYSERVWRANRPTIERQIANEVTFKQLIEGWQRERSPRPGSVDAYDKRVNSLRKFVGYEAASRVTREDAQGWKRHLLTGEKPNAKGINVKLDALHTLFAVAITNGVLKGDNPFKGLRIREKSHRKEPARRGFTDEEARTILRAARGQQGFLRWAPWLMAYSGMRIGEAAQLRPSDIIGQADYWQLAIRDAAGSVKTEASERVIPLHNAIVGEGFAAWAQGVKGDRIFPELFRPGTNAPNLVSRRGQDVMRRWIRGKLCIDDLRIAPDHSWRHWFHSKRCFHPILRRAA